MCFVEFCVPRKKTIEPKSGGLIAYTRVLRVVDSAEADGQESFSKHNVHLSGKSSIGGMNNPVMDHTVSTTTSHAGSICRRRRRQRSRERDDVFIRL